MEAYHEGIGRLNINSIPLPDDIRLLFGHYTYSGKVLVSYKTENDINETDYYNIAVINDDGQNFKLIFSGVIPEIPKANGIRYMPFQDNKRILLGDYVLECSPDIDSCTKAELIPVQYPSILSEDPKTTHRWSEIIIAPDNEHMSWTMLRSDVGAAVAIGTLVRTEESYEINNVQLISRIDFFRKDENHEGFIIPNISRGGEVKQFIQGGNAISAVGGGKNSTPDSVIQDLKSGKVTPITNTPGYDETTILSPDERLGLVMSSRFSKSTNPAIFSHLPRPYANLTSAGLAWALYTYSVSGVRKFRQGNIGPALIDIERSMNEPGYQGAQLTTDEEWVYLSPMSWHPDGKRAIWPEMQRGSDCKIMRLQRVTLLDYTPQPSIPIERTTDDIPYGIKDLTVLESIEKIGDGKIAGKHSGHIDYTRRTFGHSGITEACYHNYSDDGEHFYNGHEKTISDLRGENSYEASLRIDGPKSGEVQLKATFSAIIGPEPLKLLFGLDAEGHPQSYGYSTYDGITLNITDLTE